MLTGFPPTAALAEPNAAWVQLLGPGGAPTVRVITSEASCPALRADDEDVAMQVRAGPGPLFPADGNKTKRPPFPVTVCEATLKPGTAQAVIDRNRRVPLPPAVINRIVVLGDTGCRLNEEKTQKCRNPGAWPYTALAELAAANKPDLVIHVGDYLYREKCTGTACPPTGDAWEVWDADFFTPSKPLLAAAPWIMARGNHETCGRAREGWFRFLDGPRPGETCSDMSGAFVVRLGDIGFVVVDSSPIPGDEKKGIEVKRTADVQKLRAGYDAVVSEIPGNAWLVTHAPFNGIRRDKKSGGKVDNTILQNALGKRLKHEIKMIVSGHIHLFEGLSFSDDRPPQLVVGSGGTDLAKAPNGAKGVPKVKGLPLDRKTSVILQSFGFMRWERDGADPTTWNGTLIDQNGKNRVSCSLRNRALTCKLTG